MAYNVLLRIHSNSQLYLIFFSFTLLTTSTVMFLFKEINCSGDNLGNLAFFRFFRADYY